MLIESLDFRILLTTFTPTTSAALTSNLASAQLGDTIILQAGTTYTGNFILKNKTSGSGWITIESSNLASLPEGRRVTPANAVNMPKIVAPGSNVPLDELAIDPSALSPADIARDYALALSN